MLNLNQIDPHGIGRCRESSAPCLRSSRDEWPAADRYPDTHNDVKDVPVDDVADEKSRWFAILLQFFPIWRESSVSRLHRHTWTLASECEEGLNLESVYHCRED